MFKKQLNIRGLVNLGYFNCFNNYLIDLDFASLNKAENLYCLYLSNNRFSNLQTLVIGNYTYDEFLIKMIIKKEQNKKFIIVFKTFEEYE